MGPAVQRAGLAPYGRGRRFPMSTHGFEENQRPPRLITGPSAVMSRSAPANSCEAPAVRCKVCRPASSAPSKDHFSGLRRGGEFSFSRGARQWPQEGQTIGPFRQMPTGINRQSSVFNTGFHRFSFAWAHWCSSQTSLPISSKSLATNGFLAHFQHCVENWSARS